MAPGQPQGFGAFGTRLHFEADGFVYGGRHYAYTAVRGLEFKQKILKRVQESGGKSDAKTVYESRLRVIFVDGKKLGLSPGGMGWRREMTEDKQVYDSMAQAAEWLGAYTFNARMDGYEAAFKARGFVRWGAYEITASGDLFRHHSFCLNMRDTEVNCMLYAHRLTCLRLPKVWWRRWLGTLVASQETIDLRRDRDCFLYFMRRHVGLNWADEKLRLYRGKAADGSTDVKEPPKAQPKAEQAKETTGGSEQQKPREEQQRRAPPPKAMPTYPQYLAVLGLGPEVKWDVVRTTYRQLARKYHPDLMRGRGASAGAIRDAEERLKAINEAYGWLEGFYKLKPR